MEPKTIKESIDFWRRENAKHKEKYISSGAPSDNHEFCMDGDAETVRDALINSGKFELREHDPDTRGKYQLNHLPEKTIVLVANRGFPIGVIQVPEGWTLSTINRNYEYGGWGLQGYLDTLDDLLVVAEENKISMKTHHRVDPLVVKDIEVVYSPE